ncbi:MAG: hypothetical protein ND895_08235 [Pyrinomonadaceae bacterium]|nr:hypothetical protein [Pyrinomonadaceae bacterium]
MAGSFINLQASRILEILGPDWFAPFTALKTPGKVLWCNFELARALGFEVPSSNRMTSRFHRLLINALSYRALPPNSKIGKRNTITLHADKYGGDGLGPALGAGRSGFLPYGNLYIKGVGFTPLFRHDDPDDLAHSHGGVQMNDCLAEAVFGEVNQHLFTHGSTRILAVIDQGENVTYPYRTVPIALAIRSGRQLRPGHLLAQNIRRRSSLLEIFTKMTRETGQLVTHLEATTSKELPDIHATMIRIVHDHARTTAEQFRWRMTHGAVTPSNLEISAAMIDLTTQTGQPRTAPVCFALDDESFFGLEHIGCAKQLRTTYQALIKAIPSLQRRRLNAKSLNIRVEMERAYDQQLQLQLLVATGLKMELAERIRTEHPRLARRFKEIIMMMCELRNPGNVEMARQVVEDVSVLDVFNLLREFPRAYFAHPRANHTKEIRVALRPVFKGNRTRIAKNQALVSALIRKFDRIYRELMSTAETGLRDYYGNKATMRRSISARAAFENDPIDLYRTTLFKEFDEAIDSYRSTGNAELICQIVERKVSSSVRKVDSLLVQGNSRRLSDGGFELEMQTLDGVDYSIRAWNDRRQRPCLHVSVAIERLGKHFETPLPGLPRLTPRQISSLRYRFTTDAWVTSHIVGTHMEKDHAGHSRISCEDILDLPIVGRLQGVFCLAETRNSPLANDEGYGTVYTFAVPDKQELTRLIDGGRGKDEG